MVFLPSDGTLAPGSYSQTEDTKLSLSLEITEIFLLVATVGSIGTTLWLFQQPGLLPIGFAATGLFVFLLLSLRRATAVLQRNARERDSQYKASLYGQFSVSDPTSEETLQLLRGRAIRYCQDLVEDYKSLRQTSQRVYYLFQISTIVLSGVTPILVLLNKTDLDIPGFKWLPVIFPAVASIVTSLSTSFPFQENAVAATTAVELLEAELEKFILGVSSSYRLGDLVNASDRRLKQQEAIESFIIQVNNIHLKRFQSSSSSKSTPKTTPQQPPAEPPIPPETVPLPPATDPIAPADSLAGS